jgi:ribokinase
LIGKQPKERQMQLLKDLLMQNEKLCLLCKEGAQGATVMSSHYEKHEDAFTATDKLQIVDTTGAGDTFTAAYAITSDLRFAQAAAFLCITKQGAAESIPTLQEVNAFLIV